MNIAVPPIGAISFFAHRIRCGGGSHRRGRKGPWRSFQRTDIHLLDDVIREKLVRVRRQVLPRRTPHAANQSRTLSSDPQT